jgi:hypothetical protein
MTSSAPRAATHEDANLVLKLYEMRREDRMRDARRWFAASFKVKSLAEFQALCPPGSEANASFRMVVTYWDMVASFVTSGVLNPELFYQSGGEMLFAWERLRGILPELREANKNPIQYRNLESASRAFIDWWNQEAPGAYDAFSARIRG